MKGNWRSAGDTRLQRGERLPGECAERLTQGIIGQQRLLRVFDPGLRLREIGRRLIGEFTGLRDQGIEEKPADANQEREQARDR